MRILFVTNQGRGAHAGGRFEWLGLEFSYASFTFEDIVRFRFAPDREPVVRREALERALEEIEQYDGVLAEEPEALLLGYVRLRRGLRPVRWVVNVVQLFQRIVSLARWVEERYGEDPLRVLASDPDFFWIYTTQAQRDALLELGLPPRRVGYCPVSSGALSCFFPHVAAVLRDETVPLPPALGSVQGGVLLAGTNHRDLETTAAAARTLTAPIHVLTDLKRNRRIETAGLVYHDVVPLPEFVSAVAHARVLVVPVLPDAESCGQQTLAVAHRVGTLVVASDVPALRQHIEDGKTGWLVPPRDPAALAQRIELGLRSPITADMIEAARKRDATDAARMERLFERLFVSCQSTIGD